MEFLAKRMITPLGILLLFIAIAFGFSNINGDGVPNVMPSIEYGFVNHDWPLMIGTVLLVVWLGLFILGFILYFTGKKQA